MKQLQRKNIDSKDENWVKPQLWSPISSQNIEFSNTNYDLHSKLYSINSSAYNKIANSSSKSKPAQKHSPIGRNWYRPSELDLSVEGRSTPITPKKQFHRNVNWGNTATGSKMNNSKSLKSFGQLTNSTNWKSMRTHEALAANKNDFEKYLCGTDTDTTDISHHSRNIMTKNNATSQDKSKARSKGN